MEKLSEDLILRIDRRDYQPDREVVERTAVRGLIRREDKFALIQSKKYGEYKFPGGGMKEGETHIETLAREVREETGLIIKRESIKATGYVEEIRKGLTGDILKMKSYYYECECEDKVEEQTLDAYEAEYGYELKYVSLEEAIENNDRLTNTEKIPWIYRDTQVMKKLYENNNFAVLPICRK